jgi:hypothetical protein
MRAGSCRRKKALIFFSSRKVDRLCRILIARGQEERGGSSVAGLAVERELKIAREILVAGVDAGRVRQLRKPLTERLV